MEDTTDSVVLDEVKKEDLATRISKLVAIVFHPVLMPVYGLLVIFIAPTLLGYLPFNIKKFLFLIMLINNVLLPFSLLPFFIQKRIVSSWNMPERKDRTLLLTIITLLYITTSFIVFRFPIPGFIKSYIYGITFLAAILTVINFFWKISLHAAGAGALIGLVMVLSLKMLTPLDLYLIISIVISGLILSSRLKLNVHNPREVWIGLFTGYFALSIFMVYL